MKASKILVAGLIGGAVALGLVLLVYGLLLREYFEENVGSATGVIKEEADFNWIAIVIGHLTFGWLFAILFGGWTRIRTFAAGAKAGASIGFLISLAYGMLAFGLTNIANLPATLVDIVLSTILSAVVAGVVAAFLGRGGT